ncbi:MAG: OmpA family protein [Proteobacteria bacterium]|nr:OmpA family protein [Pseudomonadota bacterium]
MSRRLRILLIVLLGILGILLTATIGRDGGDREISPTGIAFIGPPTFSVMYRRGLLSVAGHTASADHEQQLAQIAAESFADADSETIYWPHVLPPDYWQQATTRLLAALALTRSATAVVNSTTIEITGVTGDGRAWLDALDSLRDALPADFVLAVDVIIQEDAPKPLELCSRMFAEIVHTPVGFRQSSVEIRTSSYAVLDRLVDFTHDCRDSTIAITGHSDATGNDAFNTSLSLARAQAVENYLVRAGVEPGHLSAAGAGSSVPIADNSTPRGRSLNRRIEFKYRAVSR